LFLLDHGLQGGFHFVCRCRRSGVIIHLVCVFISKIFPRLGYSTTRSRSLPILLFPSFRRRLLMRMSMLLFQGYRGDQRIIESFGFLILLLLLLICMTMTIFFFRPMLFFIELQQFHDLIFGHNRCLMIANNLVVNFLTFH
jgi:hypothetical protein